MSKTAEALLQEFQKLPLPERGIVAAIIAIALSTCAGRSGSTVGQFNPAEVTVQDMKKTLNFLRRSKQVAPYIAG